MKFAQPRKSRDGRLWTEAGFVPAPKAPRDAVENLESNPNACVGCGKHCAPSDLENFLRPDGRWTCLKCALKVAGLST